MEFDSSFWSSWFTPSSLFVVLNLVIGTIYLTSRIGSHRTRPETPGGLARTRSASIVHRVRSIDLSFRSIEPEDNPNKLAKKPSLLNRLISLGSDNKPDPEAEKEPIRIADGGDNGGKERKEERVTEEKTAPSKVVQEDCVNAKAEDFINRFRQQLKLQRLESLKRLSDMIKGK